MALSAPSFGGKLLLDHSFDDVFVQRYEFAPGSWWDDCSDYYRIAVQESGSPRLERFIDHRRECQIRPAGAVSISPAKVHQRWTWDSAQRVTLLFLNQSFLRQAALETGAPQSYNRLLTPLVLDDALIKHSIWSLVDSGNEPGSRLLFVLAARYLASYLLMRHCGGRVTPSGSPLPQWQLRRALDFIEANLAVNISLEQIAAAASTSADRFQRGFRSSVGISPYRYFVERRIERAKELLSKSDQDVTAIALSLGFSSASHFSTSFRSVVGCSPSEYRRRGVP
ncbi:hypothetical protein WI58_06175 [Burkholderia cepacia]|nr:hypothetical protein WI47_34430 [Burkholderia cepacia]KVA64796.1 hypothetical protein WI48_05805 [Burkholderia cepacia]KVA82910.1 hypothetical protein WI51_24415 [Burkholderia cepacia]KVA86696.1 hypothetical protein WI50_15005 [Burkholderia cepacia]KVA96009.1 hypothetical protein WI52_34185 [Burkholderia cepacia]